MPTAVGRWFHSWHWALNHCDVEVFRPVTRNVEPLRKSWYRRDQLMEDTKKRKRESDWERGQMGVNLDWLFGVSKVKTLTKYKRLHGRHQPTLLAFGLLSNKVGLLCVVFCRCTCLMFVCISEDLHSWLASVQSIFTTIVWGESQSETVRNYYCIMLL